MKTKAFTLIELLVVVLIIGILTAIAVPQYQVAVEKSRFSTLKEKTRALAQAINMYYLATGQYPTKLSDLDITLNDINTSTLYEASSGQMHIDFNNGDSCSVWAPSQWKMVACYLPDLRMGYYYNPSTQKPERCYAPLTNKAGLQVCAQEATSSVDEYDTYNFYFY